MRYDKTTTILNNLTSFLLLEKKCAIAKDFDLARRAEFRRGCAVRTIIITIMLIICSLLVLLFKIIISNIIKNQKLAFHSYFLCV